MNQVTMNQVTIKIGKKTIRAASLREGFQKIRFWTLGLRMDDFIEDVSVEIFDVLKTICLIN